MVIFCFLNNILYWTDYDENGNYKYLAQDDLKQEEENLRKNIKKYDKEKENEVSMYVTLKTKLDLIEVKKTFIPTSWQYQKADSYLYDIIYRKNVFQYLEKNSEKLSRTQEEYQDILSKMQSDNWEYFLKLEKKEVEKEQEELEKELQKTIDKQEKIGLDDKAQEKEFQRKILQYRLEHHIKEDYSYLNRALENYQKNYKIVSQYQEVVRNYEQELTYQNALAEMNISKYILEHEVNINKENNLNYQLRTIVEDYEIFIVLLILMISGTILTDEFRDGTIKLLLIKPYSRGKILLSKYFASLILLVGSILALILLQLFVGGIIFGLDSLKIPVVIYHFEKSQIITYSIFQYMGIRILSKIPFLLMMVTISIFLSVLSSSSMISIMIPLMLYMFTPILTNLMIQYQLRFMKFLVNINWNLQNYLFGRKREVEFITFNFSIAIMMVYFIGLWFITFRSFYKKNIKNV